jgi:ribonucleoside-triphosphate reductase
MLGKKVSEAYESGLIHIHDLDFYALTTTCCQIDLQKLLRNGFSTGHGYLREPNSITSYSALTSIAIQSNQNDQHGGQSIPNFDYALADGVKKSFRKHYRIFIAYSLTLLSSVCIDTKQLQDKILSRGIEFDLSNTEEYLTEERRMLIDVNSFALDEAIVSKCQENSLRRAIEATERETYQAMEALIHNLNTMHSRAGAQTPFSSINYGTDVSLEGRMITKNILLALEAGLGNGETPIFPIHIFRVKEGINFNEADRNYDLFKLACKVSAKRLFPNFSFQDALFNMQYYKQGHPETEIAYMGCRTRVISNIYDPNNERTYGRGNLSFTSINLPRLALNAKKNLHRFFCDLDTTLGIVEKQLLKRFDIVSKRKVKNFPFLMGEGIWFDSDKLKHDDCVVEVLKHGTLSIGFIGLAECLFALIGKHHGESIEAQELGLKIISHMRKKTDDMSEKHKLNFSLIATPAEGLAGRFVLLDKKKFGVVDGVTDKIYYTNSFHIPVAYRVSAYNKIKIEAPYHSLTNGGHITYIELDGDTSKNLIAFESIIRFMKESGIGYGAINHPLDRDTICGYTGIIDNVCPKCGRDEHEYPFERIRRITGYLGGSLERFNNAKLAEVKDRVKHGV